MTVKKQVIKLVTPKPQYGAAGIVLPIVVGGGILLGTYIILTRVLKLDFIPDLLKKISPIYPAQQAVADALGLPAPDPVLGQWPNMANDIANFFSRLSGNGITFASGSGEPGDKFGMSIVGLKPNTQFVYYWKEIGLPGVNAFAGPDGKFAVSSFLSTAFVPRTYTMVVDQKPQGGPYYEQKFTVKPEAFSF